MSRYSNNSNAMFGMFLTMLIISALSLFTWFTVRCVKDVTFNRGCSGHLQLASHANTIDLAEKELGIAVTYMEKHNMTEGYTSVLYNTPDEDVGFWYTNMSNSLKELKDLKADATPLEKSNMLIKLRESIMTNGENGSKIMLPEGISIYGYNTLFSVWVWLSIGCIGFSLIGMKVSED